MRHACRTCWFGSVDGFAAWCACTATPHYLPRLPHVWFGACLTTTALGTFFEHCTPIPAPTTPPHPHTVHSSQIRTGDGHNTPSCRTSATLTPPPPRLNLAGRISVAVGQPTTAPHLPHMPHCTRHAPPPPRQHALPASRPPAGRTPSRFNAGGGLTLAPACLVMWATAGLPCLPGRHRHWPSSAGLFWTLLDYKTVLDTLSSFIGHFNADCVMV